MNGPVLPGLWHMGHSFTITVTVNSSPILHSLALRFWHIANWSVFLVDCSLSRLIRPPVVFALPLQLTSSPTSPGPSHKLNALSTGDEEEPTKSWQIRGDLPINRSSMQEVLNHSNDRRLQHLQFGEGALLTTIPTIPTSQAIRCPCREAIHQVISPVKAYKRTAENPQIFLSDNVPNPLHNLLHNPLRSQHYNLLHKEQARAQGQLLTNPRLPH